MVSVDRILPGTRPAQAPSLECVVPLLDTVGTGPIIVLDPTAIAAPVHLKQGPTYTYIYIYMYFIIEPTGIVVTVSRAPETASASTLYCDYSIYNAKHICQPR